VSAISAVAYYEMAPACAEYARSIALLRSEAERKGDSAGAEFLKRLGVSLYGKFAQSSAYWVDSTERLADHPYHCWCEVTSEGELERWRSIGWEVQQEHKYHPGERPEKGTDAYERWRKLMVSRESGESCPALAAYITSYGRLLLWDAICKAGADNVYYYDTDSLFVNQEGYRNLSSCGLVGSGETGRLSLRATIEVFNVHGVKYYEADGVVKCSGLPKGDISAGPDRESYYLRAWIGRNLNAGERPQTQRVRRVYERTAIYTHGHVDSTGKVTPWRLG
jgi:hypothetical protein